jgi:hypothetical protein
MGGGGAGAGGGGGGTETDSAVDTGALDAVDERTEAGGTGGGDAGGGGAGDGGVVCTSGTFGGHGYAFCSSPLSWSAARADCATKGMHLVRIDDANENAWIETNAFVGVTRDILSNWRWLGATDQTVRGEWRWNDNGALFWLGQLQGTPQNGLYNNWVAGSPSNQNNDCAAMQFNSGGFWTDLACNSAQPYVCEE